MKKMKRQEMSKSFRNLLILIPLLLIGFLVNGQVSFSLSAYDCGNDVYLSNTSNFASSVFYEWSVPGFSSNNEGQTYFNGYNYPNGNYTATLNVYSNSAMTNLIGTSSQNFTFTPNIQANFSYTILSSNCVSAQVQLTDLSTNGAVSWSWRWRNEYNQWESSTLQNPLITVWANYPFVMLVARDINNCYSSTNNINIPISSCDTTAFSISTHQSCSYNQFQFINNSNFSSTAYYDWDIPLSTSFSGNTNNGNFTLWGTNIPAGTYPATLNVYSDPAKTILIDSLTQYFTVQAVALVNAGFTYNILNSNCLYSQIQLTDTSNGNPTSWNWHYTDKNGVYQISHLQNPTINIWNGSWLSLQPSNGVCHGYSFINSSFTMNCDTTYFSVSQNITCDSSQIEFVNLSLFDSTVYYDWDIPNLIPNTYYSWSTYLYIWDYYQYSPGTYPATLNVYSDPSKTILIDSYTTNYTILPNTNIQADFTYSVLNTYCNYSEIQLTDISINNPTSWIWSWQDENGQYQTSNLQNPIITVGNGTTNIGLYIQDSTCSRSTDSTITISGSSLIADAQDSMISQDCDSSIIQFYGYSYGVATGYSWIFSDGQTSTAQSPVLSFANSGLPGYALLTTSDGTCTATDSLYLPLSSGLCDSISFNINLYQDCDTVIIQFANMSLNTSLYYQWNITGLNSAGYGYALGFNASSYNHDSGNHTVTLSAYSDLLMTILVGTETQSFTVDDFLTTQIQDSIVSQNCDSSIIQFYGYSYGLATGYSWIFSNGQTSTAQSPVLSFANSSLPGYALLTTSDGTCTATDSLYLPLDSVLCDSGNVSFNPLVSYICTTQLDLYNTSNYTNLVYYDWSISPTPTPFPLQIWGQDALVMGVPAGTYQVTLSAYSDAAMTILLDTETQTIFVGINNISNTITDTILSQDCDSTTIQFFANQGFGNGFNWDVNGLNSNVENPIFTFANNQNVVAVLNLTGFCSGMGIDTVFLTNSSSFSAVVDVSNSSCSNNCTNTIGITPTGGVAPYLYSLNNGPNTTSNIFNNLCTGLYAIEVIDANGCTYTNSVVIDSIFGLSVNITTSSSVCDSLGFFIAQTSVTGGSGNYDYLWSDGSNGSILFGGTALSYSVIVTDSVSGCTASASTPTIQDCYSISGTVYVDYNGNCIVDGNDYPLAQSYQVDLVDNAATAFGLTDYLTFSDNGQYSISNVPADTYYFDVNGTAISAYPQGCTGTNVVVDANNPNPVVDLFVTPPAPVQDLSISLYHITHPAPDPIAYMLVMTYCNDGTIPMIGSVSMNYDPLLTFSSSSPQVSSVDAVNGILSWNFTNLLPGQCVTVFPNFVVPTNMALGTLVNTTVVVNPIPGDATPPNNVAYLFDTVMASADPNDKLVFPIGDMTVNQKDHSYHINFQNEGNLDATLVIVKDDLDDNLDIQTLRNVSASHNFVLTIENTDELVFTFNNIHLTPKDIDEPNSKGYLDFMVSQKDDLPLGTVIENTAEIYFDFNAPIVTNTTVNTIVEKSTALNEIDVIGNISIYPNPSKGLFNISLEEDNNIRTIEIYNVLGKKIFEARDLSGIEAVVNLQNTTNGVYVIKIETDRGVATESIVIAK